MKSVRKPGGILSFLARNNDLAIALATLASTAIALAALVASFASVYFAREALEDQHHHNVLSVRPLPMVTVYDGKDRLEVLLRNNGSGPLIIKGVEVRAGGEAKSSVIDWMPELPEGMRWDTFASAMQKRSLAPGGEIVLVRLLGKDSDPTFRKARENVRAALSPLTVIVTYTDIYDSSMDPESWDLSWFGREKSSESSHKTPGR